MALGRRSHSMARSLVERHPAILLTVLLCILVGCSGDSDCPLCPDCPVENPFVLYISYFDMGNGDLMLAKKIGDSWGFKVIDSYGIVGRYTSIALDAQNNVHISHYEEGNQYLKYAFGTGDGWLIETVDWDGNVGLRTSIALDPQGNPHICYWKEREPDCIKYANRIGGQWHVPEVIEYDPYERQNPDGDWGSSTSIVVDANGNPHIAYYTDLGSLGYAVKNESGGWSFELVDAGGDVGGDCSLTLDAEGNPHISYWDKSNSNLKYAVKSGEYWVIEVADPWGDRGKYTSIAIGTQ